MDTFALNKNEPRKVLDKTAFAGTDEVLLDVKSGSRGIITLSVSAIDPATTVTLSIQDSFDSDDGFVEIKSVARSTTGRSTGTIADFNTQVKIVATVTGGNATFKIGFVALDLGSADITTGDVAIDTSDLGQETTLQQVRDNLADIKTYTDGLETIATNILAAIQAVDGHVDGLEALATALNGFVDGIEGFTDGIEGKLDTGNASLAAIDGKVLTDTQLRAAPVPVSGPLTDTEIRATPLPVSGPLTDAQIRATALPVSGPLTDAQLRAAAVPISASALPLPSGAASEATLAAIAGYVDGLEALVAASNTLLTAIAASTDGLEGFTDGLETLAGAGNASLSSIDGKLTSILSAVDGLEGFTDGLETLIAATNSALSTIGGYVDGLEALIAASNASLTSIDTKVGLLTKPADSQRILPAVANATGTCIAVDDIPISIDTLGYASGFLAITLVSGSTGQFEIIFEGSNDNSFWLPATVVLDPSDNSNLPPFVDSGPVVLFDDFDDSFTGPYFYRVPFVFRYFRVRVTAVQALSTAIINVNMDYHAVPLIPATQGVTAQIVNQFGNTRASFGPAVQASSLSVAIATDQPAIPVSMTPASGYTTDTFTGAASGTTADVSTAPLQKFALQVVKLGAVTVWSVVLEGSIDGVNFSAIATHDNTTGDGIVLWADGFPCRYYRTRCTARTGGTSVTAHVLALG